MSESDSHWLAPRPPRQPAPSTSRAGRNLKAAIPTALILLTLLGLSLFVRIEGFVALAVVALGIALWEAAGALLVKNIKVPFGVLLVGQIVMLVATWVYGLGAGLIAYLVTAAVATGWAQARGRIAAGMIGAFVLAWIGLLGTTAVAIAGLPNGAFAVLTFILLPVANDTGGYLAGVLFGRHPIAPRISPKKSWEGFVGSVLLCLAVAVGMGRFVLGLGWVAVAALAVLAPIFSTAGDFAESMVKRSLGVKDMGSIFPGHGGMLDRLDSILFFAPVCYLVFAVSFGALS